MTLAIRLDKGFNYETDFSFWNHAMQIEVYQKEIPSKWLRRYALLVSNAANGAVLKTEL